MGIYITGKLPINPHKFMGIYITRILPINPHKSKHGFIINEPGKNKSPWPINPLPPVFYAVWNFIDWYPMDSCLGIQPIINRSGNESSGYYKVANFQMAYVPF